MTWGDFFRAEEQKDYYKSLMKFLDCEYSSKTVYPPREDLFSCFNLTPFDKVKIIILGQDPYHQPGQAHGLSFSVIRGVKIPPSLRNIYKELQADIGVKPAKHGHLESWAKEGVFLLNAVMSVEHGKAGSHKNKGWEKFCDNAVAALNERSQPLVFILWGAWAQSKQHLISNSEHLIIKSAHPSPLSARNGFFGSRPFSRANSFLQNKGIQPVNWKLPE